MADIPTEHSSGYIRELLPSLTPMSYDFLVLLENETFLLWVLIWADNESHMWVYTCKLVSKQILPGVIEWVSLTPMSYDFLVLLE